MSYQDITRAAVERAEPLDFPQRPAKQDLTITVTARVDGFDTEICYTGSIEQLLQITKRLRELGAEPLLAPAAHSAPLNGSKPKAKPVEPVYTPDGTPCCPVHHKPLTEGRYGLYCPSKAEGEHANAKGYCSLRFAE
jgi:hypothetical protein